MIAENSAAVFSSTFKFTIRSPMARLKQINIPPRVKPISRCELCSREKPLTKHHLIPRAMHGKDRFVKKFGKQEMRQRGIMICRLCHNGIHDLIPDEKHLAETFNTIELLLAHAPLARHIEWVRKQK
jgi:hypothetical protein